MLGQSTRKIGYESTAHGFCVDQQLSLTVEAFPTRYEAPDRHSSTVRPARPCSCDEVCHRWSATTYLVSSVVEKGTSHRAKYGLGLNLGAPIPIIALIPATVAE